LIRVFENISNRAQQSFPAFHVVAGNPARILKKVETTLDPEYKGPTPLEEKISGAEKPMADAA